MRWVGMAAGLLSLPGAYSQGAGMAGGPDPSFVVLHGLYWLCANLAARRPVGLAVDDAHWADSASLRFLAFMLPRLEDLPVTLIVAPGGAILARHDGALTAPQLIAALEEDFENLPQIGP